jgi:hypothetical protein
MAQNCFGLLFLLLGAIGAFSLIWTVRDSWAHIRLALSAERPRDDGARTYLTTTRPAEEVPWVARRLVLRPLAEPLPPPLPRHPPWLVRLPAEALHGA